MSAAVVAILAGMVVTPATAGGNLKKTCRESCASRATLQCDEFNVPKFNKQCRRRVAKGCVARAKAGTSSERQALITGYCARVDLIDGWVFSSEETFFGIDVDVQYQEDDGDIGGLIDGVPWTGIAGTSGWTGSSEDFVDGDCVRAYIFVVDSFSGRDAKALLRRLSVCDGELREATLLGTMTRRFFDD